MVHGRGRSRTRRGPAWPWSVACGERGATTPRRTGPRRERPAPAAARSGRYRSMTVPVLPRRLRARHIGKRLFPLPTRMSPPGPGTYDHTRGRGSRRHRTGSGNGPSAHCRRRLGPRRPGRRRRPVGLGVRLLAGRCRLGRRAWSRRSTSPGPRHAATDSRHARSASSTDMGLSGALSGAHRFDGLRSCAYGMTMDLPWPDHPSFPSVRLRHHPPRSRPAGGRARRQGGCHGVGGCRGSVDPRPPRRARGRRRPPRRGAAGAVVRDVLDADRTLTR